MSEGSPKMSPAKTESKESGERPPLYRILERFILETHEGSATTELWTECNGVFHRQTVQKIFPGPRGEFDFVDELSREDHGPCDGNHF